MPPKQTSNVLVTTHSCTKCTKAFTSGAALADHSRSTGHWTPCTVKGCSKVFTSQQALEKHLKSSVHENARPNQPRAPKQRNGAASVVREHAKPPKPTPIASKSNPTQENTPGHIRKGHIIYEAPKTVATYLIPDRAYQSSLEATRLSLPGMPQSVQYASLYGVYVPSDIHSCYIVSIPRNGGRSLVSPFIVDGSVKDFEFGLLLPKPHQQAPSISSTDLGCCKMCGSTLTSWESLGPHFKSSACSTLRTCPPTGEPLNLSTPSHERSMPEKKATMGTDISMPQNGTEFDAKSMETQPKSPWSIIPEPQRAASLAALSLKCHSLTTLVRNRYKLGAGHVKPMVVEIAPPLRPLPTPAHDPKVPKRGAVALDCEMVGVRKVESEVARISAVDYLTGEIILDTLIQPTQPVTDWRTRFSGITRKAMTAAVAENRALKGWSEARAKLWRYIDSDTILVGQALNHDLDALRMQHLKIVDSAILAKEAVGGGINRQWGLKTLCGQFLGLDIQNSGLKGHDSLEDAFAAREVVIWCIGHPKELAVWGRKQQEDEIRKKKQAADARKARQLHKARSANLNSRRYTDDTRDDIVRWEDVAEDYGWPHPDTGYDPWSD